MGIFKNSYGIKFMKNKQPALFKLPDKSFKNHSGLHRFDRPAMNTVFEIMTPHPDKYYAHQAAHEAFNRLEHLEHDLSRFIPNSDISRINNNPGQLTIISEETALCLSAAEILEMKTNGHFNIALGHLVDRYRHGTGREVISAISSKNHLNLDMERYLAGIENDEALIDLGGIAKGFAIDKMVEVLQDWDIASALIHGGQSTVFAYGIYGDSEGWPVSLTLSFDDPASHETCLLSGALSASGMDKGAHIIDPDSMKPVNADLAVWALAASATEADALSTGFICMADEEIRAFCAENPDTGGLRIRRHADRTEPFYFGILRHDNGL